MLVLSRNLSESILIGDDVTITILGVDYSGQVRIGIDAPREVNIVREELVNPSARQHKNKRTA